MAEALPPEHFGAYEGFHINPPWGQSNNGESVIAFFERGSQATNAMSRGIVVIADDPDLSWTQEVLRDTQRRALELGYVVADMEPQLHNYHLDDAPEELLSNVVYEEELSSVLMGACHLLGRKNKIKELPIDR